MRVLLPFLLLLGGCGTLGSGFERLARITTDQAREYCQWPYHHRLAAYTWIHGDLAAVNIAYGGIICPGDPETETE